MNAMKWSGDKETDRLVLLARIKQHRQDAQDWRVDAIAQGDQEMEWAAEVCIKAADKRIAFLEKEGPTK